jgi:hypothetical protein
MHSGLSFRGLLTSVLIGEPSGYVPKAEDQRERVLREIRARRGQQEFRFALLDGFGRRCAISGCDVVGVLEAAHNLPTDALHGRCISGVSEGQSVATPVTRTGARKCKNPCKGKGFGNGRHSMAVIAKVEDRGLEPSAISTQSIIPPRLAPIANRVALHGRCILAVLIVIACPRSTLMCNASSLRGTTCRSQFGRRHWR